MVSLDNTGVNAFADTPSATSPAAPAAGTTLTVAGDYAGNGGTLVVNTVLGNQNAALRMFEHTLHDRVGEPGLTARKDEGEGFST